MQKKKPQNTAYTFMGKLGDILLIPIIVLSLAVSTIMFMQRQQDSVPSIFGISIVRIVSGSMIKSGFAIGDTVILNRVDKNSLWEGDIIGFFEKYDDADISVKYTKAETFEELPTTRKEVAGRLTIDDIQGTHVRVYFHEIVGVFYDAETGSRYYETKGSSNASSDTIKVREDFVVGRYVKTPQTIRNVLRWLSSSMGMICCVCIPLGVLVIMQALALIEQINFMYVEKKLMKGEMHWQDREAMRLIKTGEMEEVCKIIYYCKVDEDEREDLSNALWLFGSKARSKKQKKYEQNVEESFDILEEQGKNEYLLFWKNHLHWKWDIKAINEELTGNIFDEIEQK